MDDPAARFAIETGAALAVAGAMAKVLPPMAAAAAIIWYSIQIWQSDTGKTWRGRWKRLARRELTQNDRVSFAILGFICAAIAGILYGLGGFGS